METKVNIYDYNPDGNDSVQKFLIDFKMKEIPVDVAEYLQGFFGCSGLYEHFLEAPFQCSVFLDGVAIFV